MKTATSLTVIALGAILAFAITASPGFLNVQVVGWILMFTGGAGMLLSARRQNWLRRRVIVRKEPGPPRRPRELTRPGDLTRPLDADEVAERRVTDEYIGQ
jgi:hypothetical protein